MKKETNLYRNEKKTTRLLFSTAGICLLLFIILLYCMGLFDGILRIRALVFSATFLVIMLYFFLKTLISLRDKSALISLDSCYFSGKTTPLSKAFGQGEWSDVTNIQLEKVGGDMLVVVSLHNRAKYKGRLSKIFQKMAYEESTQQLHLTYSASEIDLDAQTLFDLFVSYWDNARSNN
ncbi:hypothetical protein OHD16_19640 [Sphingobacterium sp. ML3W]|uniref:STM3941 family protein n=1 Tax=unclassified Sphingobacterium TaxID=2609468 RepID=UPI001CBC0A9A|nr:MULTISPECIES: STM3941 family protein [unclassified Sphingobacterium]WFA82172.1 hypothetical protein OGI71_12780 [Sphingobacterium sp. ML3W]